MKEIEAMTKVELLAYRDVLDLDMADLIQEQDVLADRLRRIDDALEAQKGGGVTE